MSSLRIALDTNVLVYAEGLQGEPRKQQAADAIAAHADSETVVPVQVLAELFSVLTRKLRLDAQAAQARVARWRSVFAPVDFDVAVVTAAMQLVCAHRIGFWDAVVLASAAEARCDLLLSEDMQDGFTWRGVTVRNPFRDPPA